MDRLDQRTLAHAPGAPQQGVVSRQAGGETPGVVEQDIAHPVDALEQRQIDGVDRVDRLQGAGLRVPDEGAGRRQIAIGGCSRG